MNHPPQELLSDYAGGLLERTLRCLVEAHIRFCPACAGRARGGLEESPFASPVAISSGDGELLIRAWGGLSDRIRARSTALAERSGVPPELLGLVEDALPPDSWSWITLIPGESRMALLLRDAGAGRTLFCLHLEPGGAVPPHRHLGRETCVVLQGGFHDAGGEYGPGEWCEAGAGTRHGPVADPDRGCWALILLTQPTPAARQALSAMGPVVPGNGVEAALARWGWARG